MDFAIPAAGMQAASSAFDEAATGISGAFSTAASNTLSAKASTADNVDLSTSVVALLEAKDNFAANLKTLLVDNEITQSTFSIFG